MNLITRFKMWRWQRQLKQAYEKQKGELREFVYLDEVSVYSLLESRMGPRPTEFTHTRKASLKAGVANFGSSGEFGSQVLRKSTVQTTFKTLHEHEMKSCVIRPLTEEKKLPKIDTFNAVMALKDQLTTDGWLVDPEKLIRGQLLDVEVQLEAEDVFRVKSVISAFLEIIEAKPEMFGIDNNKISQAKAVGQIIEKLLVNLVPVSGQSADYEIVIFEGKEWIVHRKLLSKLSNTESLPRCPLFVVGVAEESLFWKDVRRILFSKGHFRVFCRLGQNGIQNSWTPVKLAPVLDLVVPGFRNYLDTFGSEMLATLVNASKTDQNTNRNQQIQNALISYAVLLSKRSDRSLTAEDLTKVGLLSEQHCNSFNNQKERRDAFNAVVALLVDRLGIEPDTDTIAQVRELALAEAGMDSFGQPLSLVASEKAPSVSASDKRFLDTEFIAIYW